MNTFLATATAAHAPHAVPLWVKLIFSGLLLGLSVLGAVEAPVLEEAQRQALHLGVGHDLANTTSAKRPKSGRIT